MKFPNYQFHLEVNHAFRGKEIPVHKYKITDFNNSSVYKQE